MPTSNCAGVLLACALVVFLPGCASQTPRPALIDQPSNETLATLTAAASSLLNGRTVRLASNAFTQTPKLSVAPGRSNTPKGRLASGRIIVLPDELQLLRIGQRCALMHVATQKQTDLEGVSCNAITPQD